MNYAVDRESIVKSILGGRGSALPGPALARLAGQRRRRQALPLRSRAGQGLLREAGYPDGFAFQWTITQGMFAKDIEIAQAVASQLARVGITATLQPLERARLLAERNEGDYDVTELIWPMAWMPTNLFTFTLETSYPEAKLSPQWGDTPAELVEARRLVKDAVRASTVRPDGHEVSAS